MIYRFFIPVLCIILSYPLFAQQETKQLEEEDVSVIMEEILSQHRGIRQLTPRQIKESFRIFIDDFDPTRIYLLEKEISPYLNLSESRAQAVLQEYRKGNFAAYVGLNRIIQSSIERARRLRAEIEEEESDIPFSFVPLSYKEKKERSFAATQENLKERNREDWYTFLESQKALYGSSVLKSRKKEIARLYNEALEPHENNYLYTDREGRRLSMIQGENLFVLHLLKALAQSLDVNTQFFGPREALNLQMYLEKEYAGVGLVFERRLDGVTITGILAGGPAEKSRQIHKGDILTKIDEEPVDTLSMQEIGDRLRGAAGTFVELTLRNPQTGQEQSMRLERNEIVIEKERIEVAEEPFGRGIIGKITIPSFYKGEKNSTSQDVLSALQEWQRKGNLLGLVIDLRDNSGGFLTEAVKTAGLFIANGVIVIAKNGNGETEIFRDIDSTDYYNGPLVLLTSEGTASAAEILAQALRDYGVGLVVGDQSTFGKGTVQAQTVTDKEALSYFKVTVGKYFTVGGDSPEEVGVPIDIVIAQPEKGKEVHQEEIRLSKERESIPPQFQDALEDIPLNNRSWFFQYYVPTMQPREHLWEKLLPRLRNNSQKRLAKDRNYQLYLLGELPEGERDEREMGEADEWLQEKKSKDHGQEDIVMGEATNIVKDMILLQKVGSPSAKKS